LKTIEQLKDKKIKLENKVNDVKSKIDGIQNRAKERKSVEQKQRDQEREFLTF
jgi:FtsZ-binding cell division protein ZapB